MRDLRHRRAKRAGSDRGVGAGAGYPGFTEGTRGVRGGPAAHRTGQALVEFAVSFPILIVLLIAFLDFGYLLFVKNTLTHATREAIGVAESVPFDAGAVQKAVLDAAIGVRLHETEVTVTPPAAAAAGAIPTVTVSVRYRHEFFVNWWATGPLDLKFTLTGAASPEGAP